MCESNPFIESTNMTLYFWGHDYLLKKIHAHAIVQLSGCYQHAIFSNLFIHNYVVSTLFRLI